MLRWILLCLMLVVGLGVRAETRDPGTHFFMPKFGDLAAELDAARKQGKTGVLLVFEMEECPFCERMKQTQLNRVDVQEAFRKHFLIYAIDVNGSIGLTDFQGRETTEKAFAAAQRVRATPTLIFYGLDGQPLVRYPGPPRDAAELMLLGRYVVEGAYHTQPFARYKQGR